MTAQFKVILKKISEKLMLPTVSYECEKHGLDHQPSFLVKVKFEDKFGKQEQYGFKACIKKGVENKAVLRVASYKAPLKFL